MRRFAYLVTLMSVALAACASPAAAANQPSAEGGAGKRAPVVALSTPQATTVVPPEPTSQAGTLSEGEVVIELGDNSIDASQTTFEAGVMYRFRITNYGTRPHDLYINEPISIKGSYPGAMNGALLKLPKINPDQTVTVEFIFPASAVRKQWEFSSLTKNMYEDGMRWAIVVT